MKNNSPVLLVEDDLVDAMTVHRSFKELNITNKIEHSVNGVEALLNLQEMTVKPCLILLDINMPKMNGIEFLERIKSMEDYMRIPVVVLTTSNDERDKMESYNLGVAGYMLKPVDYQQFVQIMRKINIYWTLSELPA
ncbi:MAG: response regulator [Flavobacteriales bacterium]|nr:response regulator [Flavobacteriales bacterium]